MGNLTDTEVDKKEKDILLTEEIPPDTQINSEHQQNNEQEVNEDNQNSPEQNQENEEQIQEDKQQIPEDDEHNEDGDGDGEGEGEEQMQEGEEHDEESDGEGEGEEQKEEGEENNQEEEMQNQEDEEQREEGEQNKEDVEKMPEGEEHMEKKEEQRLNDQQYKANLEGRQNQYIQKGQDGQLYQVDQNGQPIRIIKDAQEREIQKSERMQNIKMSKQQKYEYQYRNNDLEGAQIAQPIFQTIQQNQIIQERQGIQQPGIQNYQQNQILQGIHRYQQNQIIQRGQLQPQNREMPYIYQNQIYEQNQRNVQQVNDNTRQYHQKVIKTQKTKGTNRAEQALNSLNKRDSSSRRREEPKDSNPKVRLESNRSSEKKIIFKNMSYTRQNLSRNSGKRSFVINKTDRQYLKAKKSNLENISSNLNEINKKNLRENIHEFVEIPREDYDNYEGKEFTFINNGMDTGEYKFIGEKILLKDSFPKRKGVINKEAIMKEITRRNKVRRKRNVTYEIVDKFYTITDIGGKTIKSGDNNEDNKKNDFYANFYNTNNYNKKKKKNQQQKGSNNNQGGQGIQRGTVNQGSQSGGPTYKSNNTGNYYCEFRREIPINNVYNNNMNPPCKNTILSIPSDNYSKYLLEQINKIRTDPQSFIGVIEDAKANIKKDRFGRLIYDGKIKIALAKGESAFNEAIAFLQNCESMEPLEYVSDLTVIPPRNEEEIKDKEDLNKKVEEMINEGITIKSFWRDVIKNPEISFLLMIVDDSGIKSGMKRKDLLDPNMKYIGVSSVEINRKFVCYLTLSS